MSHVCRACSYGKLSLSFLNTTIPGAKKMFEGSVSMDTGAAFMLVGSYAELSNPADVAVSDRLVELVMLDRPVKDAGNAPAFKRSNRP